MHVSIIWFRKPLTIQKRELSRIVTFSMSLDLFQALGTVMLLYLELKTASRTVESSNHPTNSINSIENKYFIEVSENL